MSTNYNRYLDIHLCTSNVANTRNKYPGAEMYIGGGRYFYEWPSDVMMQMRYRESKAEGFTFNNDNKGNCKILGDVELTEADAQWLFPNSTLDTTGGGSRVSYSIKDELKQLRYVACMVAIEHLQTNVVYQQLRSLMLWISDPGTRNKLRINSHGSGEKDGGMSMGGVSLSPEELVSALVRHGLTRPSSHIALYNGLAQNARWKLDEEGDKCEDCRKDFQVYRRRHHCRRCGGLFCDKCSSKKVNLKVALTGEKSGNVFQKTIQQNATAYNVKNARVCDVCHTAVTSAETSVGRTDYGLTTITLAMCLGARAGKNYSPERGSLSVPPVAPAATEFVQHSLAHGLLEALRQRELKGIKVAASNQSLVVKKGNIAVESGVDYPGKHLFIYNSFPAYVYGDCRNQEALFSLHFKGFSADIKVAQDKRAVYFSLWPVTTDYNAFMREIFARWKFNSWHRSVCAWGPLPGANGNSTLRLTPPPCVQSIELKPGGAGQHNSIIVLTVRQTFGDELFKHYKSYDVS